MIAVNQDTALEKGKKAVQQAKQRLGLPHSGNLQLCGNLLHKMLGLRRASAKKVAVLVMEIELAKRALEERTKEIDAAAFAVAALDLALEEECTTQLAEHRP